MLRGFIIFLLSFSKVHEDDAPSRIAIAPVLERPGGSLVVFVERVQEGG